MLDRSSVKVSERKCHCFKTHQLSFVRSPFCCISSFGKKDDSAADDDNLSGQIVFLSEFISFGRQDGSLCLRYIYAR